jgi:hypothetical protein
MMVPFHWIKNSMTPKPHAETRLISDGQDNHIQLLGVLDLIYYALPGTRTWGQKRI